MSNLTSSAVEFVKNNRKELCEEFCSIDVYNSSEKPLTLFMAGSPGAGKTESSKALVDVLEETSKDVKIVRIDADELRDRFDGYDGTNSSIFQPACNLAVEKLFDHVIKYDQHCILDGTLSSYDVAEKNIDRSIKHGRKIGIYYIYQDPFVAWEFTKKREKIEGRNIPKIVFIEDFFQARDNVITLKKSYGNQLSIIVEIKNIGKPSKYYFNTDNIDVGMKREYTIGFLTKELKD